jgi:hypothetical protein
MQETQERLCTALPWGQRDPKSWLSYKAAVQIIPWNWRWLAVNTGDRTELTPGGTKKCPAQMQYYVFIDCTGKTRYWTQLFESMFPTHISCLTQPSLQTVQFWQLKPSMTCAQRLLIFSATVLISPRGFFTLFDAINEDLNIISSRMKIQFRTRRGRATATSPSIQAGCVYHSKS